MTQTNFLEQDKLKESDTQIQENINNGWTTNTKIVWIIDNDDNTNANKLNGL